MSRRKAKYLSEETAPRLEALNARQSQYIAAINASPVVISTGYAGTGKTFIAGRRAAQMYRDKEIDQIILTRPNVSSGARLGFFPGTLEEKMDPWMRPLTDRLKADLGTNTYDCGVRKGNIRVEPFETMRGASFDGFVVLDEAQNTTPHEIKMFLTRFESGKVIINGDVRQSDLNEESGLATLVDMCRRGLLSFPHIDFNDPDDIVRSEVCRDVILAFDEYENPDEGLHRTLRR